MPAPQPSPESAAVVFLGVGAASALLDVTALLAAGVGLVGLGVVLLRRGPSRIRRGGGPSSAPGPSPRPRGGEWILHLEARGAAPGRVARAVRELTGLDSRRARDMVDGAPSMVASGLTEQVARAGAVVLEDAGAVATALRRPPVHQGEVPERRAGSGPRVQTGRITAPVP